MLGDALQLHASRASRSKPLDLGQQHVDVLALAEDRPQRVADLARRERSRRDLVGERLEQVEVAPIDERHLDVVALARQLQRGLQPGEAAADDHDAMAR